MSQNPSFVVRALAAEDIGSFRDLLGVFGRAFEAGDTYTAAQPDAAYLRSLLGDDRFIALAACRDATVIGGLAAYVLPKFEQARSEIFIYDLAVSADWRRRGVATALIDAVQAIGTSRGAYVIFVQADAKDAPAAALYGHYGTREEVLHFDIAVAESGRHRLRP